MLTHADSGGVANGGADVGEAISTTLKIYPQVEKHTSAYVSIRQHTSAYVSILSILSILSTTLKIHPQVE
jgi:hypothetical protein